MCLQFRVVKANARDIYPFGVHDFTVYRRKVAAAFEPVLLMHMLLHERGHEENGMLSIRLGPDWQEVCRQYSPDGRTGPLDCQLAREGFSLEPTEEGGLAVSIGKDEPARGLARRCGENVSAFLLSPLDGGGLSSTAVGDVAKRLSDVDVFHTGRVRVKERSILSDEAREIKFNTHDRVVKMLKRCCILRSDLVWRTIYGHLPLEMRPIAGSTESDKKAA